MEKIYHIIIPEFSTKEIGLKYLSDNKNYFSFFVENIVYDKDGYEIEKPSNSTIISINEIYLQINEKQSPGVLFIEGGFIKYYKSI